MWDIIYAAKTSNQITYLPINIGGVCVHYADILFTSPFFLSLQTICFTALKLSFDYILSRYSFLIRMFLSADLLRSPFLYHRLNAFGIERCRNVIQTRCSSELIAVFISGFHLDLCIEDVSSIADFWC